MKDVLTIWNGADKRNIQNKRHKQNKFISWQYIQWKHLKHYYGSITVRENILWSCVSNTTKTIKKD